MCEIYFDFLLHVCSYKFNTHYQKNAVNQYRNYNFEIIVSVQGRDGDKMN